MYEVVVFQREHLSEPRLPPPGANPATPSKKKPSSLTEVSRFFLAYEEWADRDRKKVNGLQSKRSLGALNAS